MSFWKKLKDLFGGNEETVKEAEKAESAVGEDAPIGKDELCHFTITFRHSTKSIDFESTWRQVKGMSGRFAGSKGFKMNNFYVPWDEVAFIYCGGRVADDKKEEGKEGEDLSKAKPGDEVPATDAAKALGAETMEILPDDGKGEAKAEEKAEDAKPEGKPEAGKEEAKEEAADATRDARLDEVKAEKPAPLEGVTAETIE